MLIESRNVSSRRSITIRSSALRAHARHRLLELRHGGDVELALDRDERVGAMPLGGDMELTRVRCHERATRVFAGRSTMTESVLTLDSRRRRTTRGRGPACARLEPRLGADRTADATLLVSELVTNAVKYGPEHGDIRLIISESDARVRVTVHDTGAGPLPEMRPRDRAASRGRRPRTAARRPRLGSLGRRARQHPGLVRARPVR